LKSERSCAPCGNSHKNKTKQKQKQTNKQTQKQSHKTSFNSYDVNDTKSLEVGLILLPPVFAWEVIVVNVAYPQEEATFNHKKRRRWKNNNNNSNNNNNKKAKNIDQRNSGE